MNIEKIVADKLAKEVYDEVLKQEPEIVRETAEKIVSGIQEHYTEVANRIVDIFKQSLDEIYEDELEGIHVNEYVNIQDYDFVDGISKSVGKYMEKEIKNFTKQLGKDVKDKFK